MSEGKFQRKEIEETEEILKTLSSALRSSTMYPAGHPLIKHSAGNLAELLSHFPKDWTIVLLGGEFVYEKIPLTKVSAMVHSMYRILSDKRIESITIKSGTKSKQIEAFINLIVKDDETWEQPGDMTSFLVKNGIRSIAISRVEIPEEERSFSINTDSARDIYIQMKNAVTDLFVAAANSDPQRYLDAFHDSSQIMFDAINKDRFALVSRLHTRHGPDDLAAHSVNTAIIGAVVAESFGLDKSAKMDLFTACLLHDIGNTDSPPTFDNGVLQASQDSYRYEAHPVHGLQIIRSLLRITPVAQVVAYEHHMHWDGKGFPKGPAGHKPSRFSLITALASTYETFMHGKGRTPTEQIPQHMINTAGKEFQPAMLARFLGVLGLYPPGTYVELTTGQIGLVVEPNRADTSRPIVRIERDENGEKPEVEIFWDLTEKDQETGAFLLSIRRSVLPSEVPA